MAKKRGNITTRIHSLDLGYRNAATILARQPERQPITIYLIGCGGTGSYMAQSIGRLLVALDRRGTQARAFLYDHDHVEEGNVGRQLFSRAEIGHNKAETLALRFGSAWGLDVTAAASRFKADLVKRRGDELVVLVGCVDNAAGRKEMANALSVNKPGRAPDVWWLDCGNHEEAGQVLLGSAVGPEQMKGAFPTREICQALPAPTVQSPELWIPRPEEKKAKRMSCAELVAANAQSLNVNAEVATKAANMLTRLLVTRNLKFFATEFNLAAGTARSTYATPEEVARVLERPVSFVHQAAA